MKKKNIIAFVLAGVLCCTASVPAYAREITTPGDYETTLTFSVDTDYVVVIPESAELNKSLAITSPKANTEPGMAVKVRITKGLTDGSATLRRNYDNSDYAITAKLKLNDSNETVTSETVIASFSDVTTQTTGGTLTFADPVSPDKNDVKAGSYTGSLTFTVSYEEA